METVEKINSEWIIFVQTPWDRVRYKLVGMDKFVSIKYDKFKKFLFSNFKINDIQKCHHALNSFETVFIDNTTGNMFSKNINETEIPDYMELVKRKLNIELDLDENSQNRLSTLIRDVRANTKTVFTEVRNLHSKMRSIHGSRDRYRKNSDANRYFSTRR